MKLPSYITRNFHTFSIITMFPFKQFDLGKVSYEKPSSEFLGYDRDQQKPNFSEFGSIRKDSPFASLGIVKDFASRSRKSNGEIKSLVPRSKNESHETIGQKMSTNARIRMAGQRFLDSYSAKVDIISNLNHPLPGLADDEAKDIELLLTLLTSAESTGQRQFDHAITLVELCLEMSSKKGNPVERLVHYFSEALREKIDRETGRLPCDGLEKTKKVDILKEFTKIHKSILVFHKKVPLSQVCQFSAMHTIIENVRNARKVHVIDLEIRSGMQYIVLMQGIVNNCEWKIEHLKITAVGTTLESMIKDTCDRLSEVARSMNIPYSYKIVMIEDMLDFNINLLELDNSEKVAVYSPVLFSTLIVNSKRLEHLMRVIRKINPCIITITEVEANHTSPAFVHRFIEALFYYGALFDSFSDCLENDEQSREFGESFFCGNSIRNIVACEGDERTLRHVGIDVWRAFFARFGMLEVELSAESFNEAKLLVDSYECGNSCVLHFDGPCFIVGWKGVPIFSISAWKFL